MRSWRTINLVHPLQIMALPPPTLIHHTYYYLLVIFIVLIKVKKKTYQNKIVTFRVFLVLEDTNNRVTKYRPNYMSKKYYIVLTFTKEN